MLFCLIGYIVIVLVGSFSHFVYDILKHNKKVGWLFAVNESTWEHLKLIFWPMFLWYIIGLFVTDYHNYHFAMLIAILVACVTIPVIFYSYTAISKKPILAIDISSFVVAVGLGCLSLYFILIANQFPIIFNIIGMVGIAVLLILFIVFTYYPPHVFLFRDPISQKYGIKGHFDDIAVGNNYTLKHKK